MSALSPAIRSGPALAVLVALAMATPAGARDADTPHHYTISGHLTPADASAQGGMQMQSQLSAPASNVVAQSGDQFVLVARLHDQPDTCGSDTIFENGFDP